MGLLLCTNHPDAQGDVIGMPWSSTCPNFRPQPQPAERLELGDQRGLLVCTIPLTQKKVALVDAVDYERVNAFKWCACRVGKQWYAYRKHFGKTLRMHQFIMNPPKGMCVGKATRLGTFDTDARTARAYDRKAIELFGDFVWLSFLEEWDQRIRETKAERRKAERVRLRVLVKAEALSRPIRVHQASFKRPSIQVWTLCAHSFAPIS